ncbi:type III secretion system outer membrane pore InvG [Serratia quinivorans]|uniref:type III secretion system outer membrane ring subunit SctC n=1 Tax=Serratia quinivorans TaxID=137545 RepID=UPI002177594D|nr:type III secretion system outer membrane ring subunit SctC [Serratia quinivorans]CAI1904709.1 type III secretion system outer membrane pore InvG [Serratia quinivorans]
MLTKHKGWLCVSITTFVLGISVPSFMLCAEELTPQPISQQESRDSFIANNIQVGKVLEAISERLDKPIILSRAAAQKKVTGNFNLASAAEMFKSLTRRMALVWYDDGASIYVYDNSEMTNQLIRTRYVALDDLLAFIKSTGIYDPRFPVRSKQRSNIIYVSGPPLYVELVVAAANYLDRSDMTSKNRNVVVIPLKNTFVNDRSYSLRGSQVTIPGMVSVLQQLFVDGKYEGNTKLNIAKVSDVESFPALPFPQEALARREPEEDDDPRDEGKNEYSLSIIGYPNDNSLLVKGSERQIEHIRQVVSLLDTARRQVELSLWIIDISRSKLEDLGVRWQAVGSVGNNRVIFNSSTIDSSDSFSFLTRIDAISRNGDAKIVSRPLILTQENTPAVFDNNTSFYTRVEGERVAALEQVTYGTMISVLPRIAWDDDVEMEVNIEDGNLAGPQQQQGALPMVNRTNISTVARIPKSGSLLIGGYTREQFEQGEEKIPLLGDIPFIGRLFSFKGSNHQSMVRVFLIQPRLLSDKESWDGKPFMGEELLNERLKDKNVLLQGTVKLLQDYVGRGSWQ